MENGWKTFDKRRAGSWCELIAGYEARVEQHPLPLRDDLHVPGESGFRLRLEGSGDNLDTHTKYGEDHETMVTCSDTRHLGDTRERG